MLNEKKILDEYMIVQNKMHDNAHIRTQKQFSDQVDKLSKNKKDDEGRVLQSKPNDCTLWMD